MNDRELLELAAKAARVNGQWSEYHNGICHSKKGSLDMHVWRPLEDDGDALRLAADLELIISIDSEFTRATDGMLEGVVLACGDRYAATRRAIVRAAAAIGEAMQ